MTQILVLGAGLVARPLVRYLLEKTEAQLKVASRTVSKAEKLVANHPRGQARQLNVEDEEGLQEVVTEADIVVSLLPWIHHMKVARLCVEHN